MKVEKNRFCSKSFALFVWAFPIAIVYTYCQMKGTLDQKVIRAKKKKILKMKSPVRHFSLPYVNKIHLQTNIKECQNT